MQPKRCVNFWKLRACEISCCFFLLHFDAWARLSKGSLVSSRQKFLCWIHELRVATFHLRQLVLLTFKGCPQIDLIAQKHYLTQNLWAPLLIAVHCGYASWWSKQLFYSQRITVQYNVIIRCLVRGWETWAEVLVKKVYVTQRQIKKIKKQLCSTEINSCMRNQSAAGACMIHHLFLRANSPRHNTYLFWEPFILVGDGPLPLAKTI